MDISEVVTVPHEMKRGNYAVRNSDSAVLGDASYISEHGIIASYDVREEAVGHNRQAGTCQADANGSHNRHERGSLCAGDCVQGEPIQRGLLQQIEWSTWSMAVTLGTARVVITQTNKRSTRLCATSL
jgi:hypothetical protein